MLQRWFIINHIVIITKKEKEKLQDKISERYKKLFEKQKERKQRCGQERYRNLQNDNKNLASQKNVKMTTLLIRHQSFSMFLYPTKFA